MKKHVFRLLLAFIPNILIPVGLYLAGDKNIISIKILEGEYLEYNISIILNKVY
uniref:Uncharacterized protein n=1 Tax=Alsidium seaforthii TaxID=2007182 RepID=A0A1Z1MDJ5_9FLOR|nr:hypothetical protein [Bryothamnion seaforthii]ARW63885.1 hypothetical protein [Bryothamnion seaforthii]